MSEFSLQTSRELNGFFVQAYDYNGTSGQRLPSILKVSSEGQCDGNYLVRFCNSTRSNKNRPPSSLRGPISEDYSRDPFQICARRAGRDLNIHTVIDRQHQVCEFDQRCSVCLCYQIRVSSKRSVECPCNAVSAHIFKTGTAQRFLR